MNNNLLKTFTCASALSLGLVACAPAATPAPANAPAATIVPAAKAAEPTRAPASAEPTKAPAVTEPAKAPAVAAPAGGVISLKIVEGESNAQYEVDETLFNQNNKLATAIGITPKVNGEIKLDPKDPSKTQVGKITIDISLLKSDGHPNGNGSPRRDNFIKNSFLESAKFPIVEFAPTNYEGLPTAYKTGDTLKFKMVGDMKVHDTAKPVTWDVEATYDGSVLKGRASTALKMSLFGVQPPNIAGMLRAEDDTKLALVFVAKP